MVVEYLDTFDVVVDSPLAQDEMMKRWNEDDILNYIKWEEKRMKQLMAWEKFND